MKKINLLLCATVILSCAKGFAMEDPAKEYAKVGISVEKIDMAKPAASIIALKDAFIEKYGITPQELVRALKIRADLEQKYVDYAKKKMDKFQDIKNEVERRSKIANKILRKYIKTGDLYTGIAKEAKKDHYKNYKKEVLIIIPKMGLNKKFIVFPRYGYTGKKHEEKKSVKKDAKKADKKPALKKPAGKKFVTVKKEVGIAKPKINGVRKPVMVKETEIDIWEVEPLKKPNLKAMPKAMQPNNLPKMPAPMMGKEPKVMPNQEEPTLAQMQVPKPAPKPDHMLAQMPAPRPGEEPKPIMPRPYNMLAQDDEQANLAPRPGEEPKPIMPRPYNMLAQDVEEDLNSPDDEGEEPNVQ
jgi:hypothetical protein